MEANGDNSKFKARVEEYLKNKGVKNLETIVFTKNFPSKIEITKFINVKTIRNPKNDLKKRSKRFFKKIQKLNEEKSFLTKENYFYDDEYNVESIKNSVEKVQKKKRGIGVVYLPMMDDNNQIIDFKTYDLAEKVILAENYWIKGIMLIFSISCIMFI
jgi:hypothetical protein